MEAIFKAFDHDNDNRLSRDEMIDVIVLTQDVSRSTAEEQVDLALAAMGEFDILGEHIENGRVTFEGFKLAYVEFGESSIEQDYSFLEACGMLETIHI